MVFAFSLFLKHLTKCQEFSFFCGLFVVWFHIVVLLSTTFFVKVIFVTILSKSQWFYVVFNLIASFFCSGIVKIKLLV
jgi:hypothetical protein